MEEVDIYQTILLTHAERRRLVAALPAEHRFIQVSDGDFYTDLIPRTQFRVVSASDIADMYDQQFTTGRDLGDERD